MTDSTNDDLRDPPVRRQMEVRPGKTILAKHRRLRIPDWRTRQSPEKIETHKLNLARLAHKWLGQLDHRRRNKDPATTETVNPHGVESNMSAKDTPRTVCFQ